MNRSAEPRTILLVRAPGDEAVITRVRADLVGFGWTVVEMTPASGDAFRPSIEDLALGYLAAAALRVDSAEGQVEIYLGKTLGNLFEVLKSEGGPTDAQILALRTTEALRAHGLHTGPPSAQTVPNRTRSPDEGGGGGGGDGTREAGGTDVAPSTQADALPPPAHSRLGPSTPIAPVVTTTQTQSTKSRSGERSLWLSLAPVATLGPNGPGLAGFVGAEFDLSRSAALAASAQLPIYDEPLVLTRGSAEIQRTLVALGLEAFWLQRSRLFSSVGVSIASIRTKAQGTQSQLGYQASTDATWTTGVQIKARIGVPISSAIRLFGSLDSGVSIPEVRVEFADTVVQTWGRPYGMVSVGVQMRSVSWP